MARPTRKESRLAIDLEASKRRMAVLAEQLKQARTEGEAAGYARGLREAARRVRRANVGEYGQVSDYGIENVCEALDEEAGARS